MVGRYMNENADRNGTCSYVLGRVDQLIIDNAIMDEVREKKKLGSSLF